MQAALLPSLFAGASAGGAAATVATAASLAAPVLGGMAEYRQARAMRRQEEINGRIADARAMQTETAARMGLEQELGTMRAVFTANGARPSVGNLEVIQDVRRIRDRETRIAVNNERQSGDDFRRQGAAYGAQGRTSLMRGLVKGAPSLFDLLEG